MLVPTDLPAINAMSEVAGDVFRKLGMNLDYTTLDWGATAVHANPCPACPPMPPDTLSAAIPVAATPGAATLARRIATLAGPTLAIAILQSAGQLIETVLAARQGTLALAGWALVLPFTLLLQQMSAGAMGGGVVSAIARARWALSDRPSAASGWGCASTSPRWVPGGCCGRQSAG